MTLLDARLPRLTRTGIRLARLLAVLVLTGVQASATAVAFAEAAPRRPACCAHCMRHRAPARPGPDRFERPDCCRVRSAPSTPAIPAGPTPAASVVPAAAPAFVVALAPPRRGPAGLFQGVHYDAQGPPLFLEHQALLR